MKCEKKVPLADSSSTTSNSGSLTEEEQVPRMKHTSYVYRHAKDSLVCITCSTLKKTPKPVKKRVWPGHRTPTVAELLETVKARKILDVADSIIEED
jgi:hypothetical protein